MELFGLLRLRVLILCFVVVFIVWILCRLGGCVLLMLVDIVVGSGLFLLLVCVCVVCWV